MNKTLFSSLIVGLIASPGYLSASTIDFDQESGMFLARGYDSISGEIRGDCVERTKPISPAGANAQRTTFSLSQVENYNSLAHQTGLSASAGISLGAGSANGKMSFIQSKRK
jgi:hypothetical protein